ncbi:MULTISPECIES: flagellar hook-associated protein FlgL [unclassified Janthinobacterium]|uniref:flagellar hook-associated protein FlgL n=1 Tax=unclassified Janthinobacterium TaxID=2610881 RepID=UPI0016199C08|nr:MULTISPECIES: flagellar hook-associated protein FlgL [unclassified Janthinobacterium]MBB5608713.1 flagellar hook-associated protein 3 FlgL [Janthinobacterium sp. S3T4]MBB5613884.1 flagellar hook-associated protein 3 FlgL [Janthinobacterium sp. S3M3]
MRISTRMIYDAGSSQLNTLQGALNRTQMQLSANRRNLTPADDPIASARALEVTQSQSINTQFVTNRSNAKNFLSQEDLALGSTTSLIADVQELVVKAGNPALKDVDRQSLATELQGRLTDLMGIANTSDNAGGYLFGGYKSSTQPFSQTAAGAIYVGDQGQRQLQVGSSRYLPTSDSGAAVFENNLTGNGKFTTAADTGNFTRGGAGIISGGTVTDPTKLTGHKYSIDFQVTGTGTDAVTTYTVTDVTLGQTIPNPAVPVAYKAGDAINFDGQQVSISGKPADQDKFTLAPSGKESIFTTLTNLIGALNQPASGEAGQARLTGALNAAHNTLDTAYDNVLSVRAEVGSRLKELDTLDSAGDDLDLQYASTLSGLQDLDVVKAISQFSQQQTTLQAAQKTFTAMSGLSLFNYIS